jgi:putative membrane protein (TIGR04086 family)
MIKGDIKPSKTPIVDNRPLIIAMFKGVAMAFAVTWIVFIIYALLLTYTSVTEKGIPAVVMITTIIATLIAGFDAAKGARSRGWMWGMGAGLIYAMILLVIGTWVTKRFAIDRTAITSLITCISGGGLGGMIGINAKR